MKKKLNILCVLVFVVIFLLIAKNAFEFGTGIYAGAIFAGEKREQINKGGGGGMDFTKGETILVDVFPTKAMLKPDSVFNEKTGQYIRILHTQFMAEITPKGNNIRMGIIMIIGIIQFITIIGVLVYFIKLIISINRSSIFNWENVKRLRFMGYALLISFLCTTTLGALNLHAANAGIELERYILNPTFFLNNLPDLFLILGCLIVAEIFAIGLKMKEEQDLTI